MTSPAVAPGELQVGCQKSTVKKRVDVHWAVLPGAAAEPTWSCADMVLGDMVSGEHRLGDGGARGC